MAADNTTVTVIGLGLMGSALARAFGDAGHDVTVWNRSAARAVPFADSARIADTVHDAVTASATVVVSLLDYAAANNVLRTPAVEQRLAGKTIVQLTTGSPADARDSQAWARRHEAAYLDGAIAHYPRTIGTDGNLIFYSGDGAAFEAQSELLSALGGKATFLGEDAGAAATFDLAALEFAYAQVAGLLHAVALCAAESFPLDVFFATAGVPDGLLEFATRHDFTDSRVAINPAIAAGAMARPRSYLESSDATLAVHAGAIAQIVRASQAAGIDSAFPQALHDAYGRAAARGHGNHDLPAVYEAFTAD